MPMVSQTGLSPAAFQPYTGQQPMMVMQQQPMAYAQQPQPMMYAQEQPMMAQQRPVPLATEFQSQSSEETAYSQDVPAARTQPGYTSNTSFA